MLPLRTAPLLIALALAFVPVSAARAQTASNAYFEFLMARQLEMNGDAPGALAALNRAAALDPASAEIRAEIAAVNYRRNQRDEAEKAARAALQLDGDNVEAHRVLGLLLAGASDTAQERRQNDEAARLSRDAIAHLERVATLPSADIQLHFTLGRLYLRANAPDKAVTALGRVLNQNPNSVQGRIVLAQAYAASDDLAKAIDTLDEIVEDEPRVAAVLAQYQEQAGRPKDAAASYARAIQITPRNPDLKFRRVLTLIDAKEFGDAATAAGEARTQHPNDLRFPRLQARALLQGGSRERAIEVLEGAAKAFPKDVSTQFALADLYNNADRPRDAERTMRLILEMEPGNADALNYLGYILAERGEQLDEAIRLVERALEVEPGNPSFLDSLGWAHFRRGNVAEAEKYLLPAAEKLPKNSVIQDHAGDVHARRGRWQQAIDAWNRALDGDGRDLDRDAVERKIREARSKLPR